jgi:exosortase
MLLPLAALAAGLFAFRDVLVFEPYRPAALRVDAAEQALFTPQGGSFVVFALAAGWLAWRRRDVLRASAGSGWAWPALSILLTGGLLYAWAIYVASDLLLFYVLALILPGLGILLAGGAGLRVFWRPALVLLVVAPMPAVVLNAVVYRLQMATLHTAKFVLSGLGQQVESSGDRLYTAGGGFQVIETCSGVGIITVATVMTLLYTIVFRTSRLRTLVLLALAPLIGFLMNGIRVVSLILYPNEAGTVMHEVQGMAAMLGVILVLYALDELLRRVERVCRGRLGTTAAARAPARAARPADRQLRLVAVVGVLGTLGVASVLLPTWEAGPSPRLPHLPHALAGWRSHLLSPDRLYLGSVTFSDEVSRRYRQGDESVEILLGSSDRLDPQRSAISPKTKQPGSGWRLEKSEPFELPLGRGAVEATLFAEYGGPQRMLSIHWRENVSSLPVEVLRGLLAFDRGPFRRSEDARVIRVTTPIGRGGVAAAMERLQDFTSHLLTILDADTAAAPR